MKALRNTLIALAAAAACAAALADVNIGVSLSLTGPGSGLGIPMQNYYKIFPKEIAGEKVNLIILDDASDPGKGAQNARRFVTDDHVDMIIGSCLTTVAAAIVDIAAEAETVQLAASPVGVPPGKDRWLFRLPQSNSVMAHAMVAHMKAHGVKTVGFLGYTDAYGEQWLKEFTPEAEKNGIKVIAVERFARSDTSVTPQALKLTAATKDLMRVGGKAVDGTYVVSGPAVIAEQLPDSHPSKKVAIDFVTKYEKAVGPNTRNQFAGHAYDSQIVLEKVLPVALKKAKPGTKEFRAAIRDAMENMGRTIFSHGVMHWTKDDHWGFTNETGVMLKVVDGDFKVEP
jgi:branched-chain amino acid transport system substrate-binding protein